MMQVEYTNKNLQNDQTFVGRNLQGVSFLGALLQNANFSKSDLRGANFNNSKIDGRTQFANATWDGETTCFHRSQKATPEKGCLRNVYYASPIRQSADGQSVERSDCASDVDTENYRCSDLDVKLGRSIFLDNYGSNVLNAAPGDGKMKQCNSQSSIDIPYVCVERPVFYSPDTCTVGNWGNWQYIDQEIRDTSDNVVGHNCVYERTRNILRPGNNICPLVRESILVRPGRCNQDCELSTWAEWSDCSGQCGTQQGTQMRTRNILVSQAGTGRACGDLVQERVCVPPPCPIDCIMTEWGPCDENGQRERDIVQDGQHGGISCGTLTQQCTREEMEEEERRRNQPPDNVQDFCDRYSSEVQNCDTQWCSVVRVNDPLQGSLSVCRPK